MYYVLNVSGWECYEPYWFKCSFSKKEFEKRVQKAIKLSLPLLLNGDGFIDGHDLLDELPNH